MSYFIRGPLLRILRSLNDNFDTFLTSAIMKRYTKPPSSLLFAHAPSTNSIIKVCSTHAQMSDAVFITQHGLLLIFWGALLLIFWGALSNSQHKHEDMVWLDHDSNDKSWLMWRNLTWARKCVGVTWRCLCFCLTFNSRYGKSEVGFC